MTKEPDSKTSSARRSRAERARMERDRRRRSSSVQRSTSTSRRSSSTASGGGGERAAGGGGSGSNGGGGGSSEMASSSAAGVNVSNSSSKDVASLLSSASISPSNKNASSSSSSQHQQQQRPIRKRDVSAQRNTLEQSISQQKKQSRQSLSPTRRRIANATAKSRSQMKTRGDKSQNSTSSKRGGGFDPSREVPSYAEMPLLNAKQLQEQQAALAQQQQQFQQQQQQQFHQQQQQLQHQQQQQQHQQQLQQQKQQKQPQHSMQPYSQGRPASSKSNRSKREPTPHQQQQQSHQHQHQQQPHPSQRGSSMPAYNPFQQTTAMPPPPPSTISDGEGTSVSNSYSNSNHTNINTSSKLNPNAMKALTVESPLPPLVQRCLGDRSYEKRKHAALEVEALVKSLSEAVMHPPVDSKNPLVPNPNPDPKKMLTSLIAVLSQEFCTSMNSNYRKGGLIGLAATAIGLMSQNLAPLYLQDMISPVLMCFDDPEARVRYYACESLYNIIKVTREHSLVQFHLIFDGLTKLFADVDPDVKNGANLLDRLVKDIVTESDVFRVEEFLPLLQNYIRRTNPYIRQLLVGWITVLDGIPDVSMIDYLPDFLDGLFNMLADSNPEIRQAADSALGEFLKEVRTSAVVEFGPIVSILVFQCHAKERLNRLTAITWLAELIHHPHSGGDALLPFHAEVLGAIMTCISDVELEIRKVSERTNADFLAMVKDTKRSFDLSPLLKTLMKEVTEKTDVPTKLASLRWINMLLEQRRRDINAFIKDLLPVLLHSLNDSSDAVVLLTVQVLSRISLANPVSDKQRSASGALETNTKENPQFEMVVKAILQLFATDRRLLETRGSLIVRRLCVLLNAKSVYTIMAEIISSRDFQGDLEFIATMVQTLNLILLTASELHSLRSMLAQSRFPDDSSDDQSTVQTARAIQSYLGSTNTSLSGKEEINSEGAQVFAALFHCWAHNPVATFSLCLLARTYDIAFALVKKFSELEVTVGFLMQIDKLVHLLESPIFVHLRLQLLDVEAPYHTYLLKSCYGLLMLLPQSQAFRALNDRLATVCNLRDSLGIKPMITSAPDGIIKTGDSSVFHVGLDAKALLDRFDNIAVMHRQAREAIQQNAMMHQDQIPVGTVGGNKFDGSKPLDIAGHAKGGVPSTWNGNLNQSE